MEMKIYTYYEHIGEYPQDTKFDGLNPVKSISQYYCHKTIFSTLHLQNHHKQTWWLPSPNEEMILTWLKMM